MYLLVMSFWIFYIHNTCIILFVTQFMLGVYIVRTEKAEDRQRIQGEVDWRSGGQAENRRRQGQDPPNPRTRGLENIEKTKGYILGGGQFTSFTSWLAQNYKSFECLHSTSLLVYVLTAQVCFLIKWIALQSSKIKISTCTCEFDVTIVLFDVPLVLHLQLLNTLQGIPLHQNPGVIQLNLTLCLLQIPRPKTLWYSRYVF